MANNSATLVRYETSPGGPLASVPAGGGKVELVWAPLGTTDFSLFHPVAGASPVTINPTPGRFSSATAVTIPGGSGGIAPGAIVSAMLRGWLGTYPDYTSAALMIGGGGVDPQIGYSSIFQIDTGDPTAVPAGTPGNIVTSVPSNGFTGLNLMILPEPTSFALLGLGAGMVAVSRRRRSLK